jgi:hypothetical protein
MKPKCEKVEPRQESGEVIGPEDLEVGDDTVITCWCGEKGTYDQLFDDAGLSDRCGGMGTLDCRCGGDLCVCHNHGETECFGCPDCEDDAGDDDFNSEHDED